MNDKIAQTSTLPIHVARCMDVAAVIVTYNPVQDAFLQGLHAIAMQVGMVIVVDNASQRFPVQQVEALATDTGTDIKIIALSSNVGLGAGFNIGIDEAHSRHFSFVVLFDQDSVPHAGMVARLKQAYQKLGGESACIGALGPRFRDPQNNTLSDFVDFKRGRIRLIECGEPEAIVQVGMLISSGSFISMRAIDDIGNMDETLFIDHVDTEWCIRARVKGWSIYGVCDAIMEHSLGENRRRVWLLRWRNVPCHASFRYYYILRNVFILCRRDYVTCDICSALYIYAAKLVVCLLFILPNKIRNIKMAIYGMLDGRRGISGPLP